MQPTIKQTYLSATIATILAVSAAPSFSQTAPQQADTEERKGLEVITVTTQRRAQSIQTVAVAVTALDADALEAKQVTNVLDLQYQIPNISLATNTGTSSGARIFLRGVGEDESRVTADPAVGVYVDGVYVGRQVGALFDLVDLARIEVLRGPQGTLYGRNSNGGAIKLVSKSPDLEENYNVAQLSIGSDNLVNARYTGNFAVSENTGIRATALSKNRDGFHTLNPNGDFAGMAGTNIGKKDTLAFRVSVLHQFSNDWKMNLAVDYTQDDSDPAPDSVMPGRDADNNIFTIEPLGDAVCSTATPSNFLGMGCFTDYRSEVKTQGLTLNVKGVIGDYDIEFLTGIRNMEDDLSSRIGFPYIQQTDQDQLSQEVTLSSNYSENFNFVAGLYYFEEDVSLDSIFVFPFEVAVKTDAIAAFFQSDYVMDTLTLTTGIRFTRESKDLDALAVSNGITRVESRDFNNSTYTIALKNRFTKDIMGYASYATGFKSGGWSPDCFAAPACFLPVDEEELDTLEFGIKSDWLDNTLRLNMAYFFNSYDNLQIASSVPGLGFTRFNVDETEINGFEVEALYKASDNIVINFTLGTLDAKYKKLTSDQAGGLTNNGSTPSCNGVVSINCALGLELKNAPEYKATFGLAHNVNLSNGELTSRIDFSIESDSWNLVANAPESALTSVGTIINARVAYEPNDESWQVAAWVKNLSDQEYARASTANSFSQYAADPMTWGVDFVFRF